MENKAKTKVATDPFAGSNEHPVMPPPYGGMGDSSKDLWKIVLALVAVGFVVRSIWVW
jgi:hypothetical protein